MPSIDSKPINQRLYRGPSLSATETGFTAYVRPRWERQPLSRPRLPSLQSEPTLTSWPPYSSPESSGLVLHDPDRTSTGTLQDELAEIERNDLGPGKYFQQAMADQWNLARSVHVRVKIICIHRKICWLSTGYSSHSTYIDNSKAALIPVTKGYPSLPRYPQTSPAFYQLLLPNIGSVCGWAPPLLGKTVYRHAVAQPDHESNGNRVAGTWSSMDKW
jgi:hypothetical protein